MLQVQFLQRIKDITPANLSFVEELADLLEISTDSAYRRIRGETDLSLDEAAKLSKKYKISLDVFLQNIDTQGVLFEYEPLDSYEKFITYLHNIHGALLQIKALKGKLIYVATDLPIFYHFAFREHNAFKIYSWFRYIMYTDPFQNQKFAASLIEETLLEECKKVYQAYQEVDSIEIWTETTIDSTLKQIEYYHELGLFAHQHEALLVSEQLIQVLNQVKQQAVDKCKKNSFNFELYQSELPLDNNCILTKEGNLSRVHLRHQSLNIMTTQQENFCKQTEEDLQNTMRKSILLSGVSEKQRYQFFNKMQQKIENLIQKLG